MHQQQQQHQQHQHQYRMTTTSIDMDRSVPSTSAVTSTVPIVGTPAWSGSRRDEFDKNLNSLIVPDLKDVLSRIKKPRTGRKQELIQRVKEATRESDEARDECERCVEEVLRRRRENGEARKRLLQEQRRLVLERRQNVAESFLSAEGRAAAADAANAANFLFSQYFQATMRDGGTLTENENPITRALTMPSTTAHQRQMDEQHRENLRVQGIMEDHQLLLAAMARSPLAGRVSGRSAGAAGVRAPHAQDGNVQTGVQDNDKTKKRKRKTVWHNDVLFPFSKIKREREVLIRDKIDGLSALEKKGKMRDGEEGTRKDTTDAENLSEEGKQKQPAQRFECFVCGGGGLNDGADVVRCKACGLSQHIKCVVDGTNFKRGDDLDDFLCVMCRSRLANPFVRAPTVSRRSQLAAKRLLGKPPPPPPPPTDFSLLKQPFVLAPPAQKKKPRSDVVRIMSSRTFAVSREVMWHVKKNVWEVHLECFTLLHDRKPESAKVASQFQYIWPRGADVRVNYKVCAIHFPPVPDSQSRPRCMTNSFSSGGSTGPHSVDISELVKEGSNTVVISGYDNDSFGILVRLVERRDTADVISDLVSVPSGDRLRVLAQAQAEHAAEIRRKTSAAANEDTDDVLVSSESLVSLLCVLTGSRMRIPARFKQCSHAGAFDLSNVIELSKASRKFECPFCSTKGSIADFDVDPFLLLIVRRLEGSQLLNDEEEVAVCEDTGRWKPKMFSEWLTADISQEGFLEAVQRHIDKKNQESDRRNEVEMGRTTNEPRHEGGGVIASFATTNRGAGGYNAGLDMSLSPPDVANMDDDVVILDAVAPSPRDANELMERGRILNQAVKREVVENDVIDLVDSDSEGPEPPSHVQSGRLSLEYGDDGDSRRRYLHAVTAPRPPPPPAPAASVPPPASQPATAAVTAPAPPQASPPLTIARAAAEAEAVEAVAAKVASAAVEAAVAAGAASEVVDASAILEVVDTAPLAEVDAPTPGRGIATATEAVNVTRVPSLVVQQTTQQALPCAMESRSAVRASHGMLMRSVSQEPVATARSSAVPLVDDVVPRNANAQPPALGRETTEPRRPANYPRGSSALGSIVEREGSLSQQVNSSTQLPAVLLGTSAIADASPVQDQLPPPPLPPPPLSGAVVTPTTAPPTAAAPEPLISDFRAPSNAPPPNRTLNAGMMLMMPMVRELARNPLPCDVGTNVRESETDDIPNTTRP